MKPRTIAVAALVLLAGCGLEDYESRMAARLAVLQEQSRYAALWGPTTIDDIVGENEDVVEYPITIRLPRQFGSADWFRVGSQYRHLDAAEADVLYPPFLGEFPGFNRVGEAFGEPDERSTISYYCYLGVLESRSAKFASVLADLRKKTAEKLAETSPWQDVECRDEQLVGTTWKMMEARGKQSFVDRSGGRHTVDGTFRVYAREDQGYIVLWAVRVPDSIRQTVGLVELADAVAGTVKITAPAPTEPVEPAKTDDAAPGTSAAPADATETPSDATDAPADATEAPDSGESSPDADSSSP